MSEIARCRVENRAFQQAMQEYESLVARSVQVAADAANHVGDRDKLEALQQTMHAQRGANLRASQALGALEACQAPSMAAMRVR